MSMIAVVPAPDEVGLGACVGSADFARRANRIERDTDTRAGSNRTRAALDLGTLSDDYCDRCLVFAQCMRWARSDPKFVGVAAGKFWRRGHVDDLWRDQDHDRG